MVYIGSIIYAAVKPIFKIYFIIGFGILLGRRNILTVDTARNLSDMIITLLLPCLLFNKMVTNLESSDIKQIGIIALVSFLLICIGGLVSYFAYLVGRPPYWKGTALVVGMMPNISDLPIAYLQTFAIGGLIFTEEEGEKGISYICIFTMFQLLYQFNFGVNNLIGWDFSRQLNAEELDLECKKVDTASTSGLRSISEENEDEEEECGDDDSTDENSRVPIPDLEVHTLTHATSGLSRHLSHSSTLSIRRQPSQNIHDLINEYSEAASINRNTSIVRPGRTTDLEITERQTKSHQSIFMKLIAFFVDNMTKPISMTLIVAIVIAMIPWLKGIFVPPSNSHVHIPNAPDGQPPLSFIMDTTAFLGAACVPLGLLILGSTLARLSIGEMPSRFWVTPLLISLFRMIVSPVIGAALVFGLSKGGLFDDDRILQFVCTIVWCLPNATSIIYITAFYTPLENSDRYKQMDYLALTYLMQYPILAIALPFLTTFTMEVLL